MNNTYFVVIEDIKGIKDGTNNDYLTYMADIYSYIFYSTVRGKYATYSVENIEIYPTLEKAQDKFIKYHKKEYDKVLHNYMPQSAILEIEIDFSNKVKSLNKLYEIIYTIDRPILLGEVQRPVFCLSYEIYQLKQSDHSDSSIQTIDKAYSAYYKTSNNYNKLEP